MRAARLRSVPAHVLAGVLVQRWSMGKHGKAGTAGPTPPQAEHAPCTFRPTDPLNSPDHIRLSKTSAVLRGRAIQGGVLCVRPLPTPRLRLRTTIHPRLRPRTIIHARHHGQGHDDGHVSRWARNHGHAAMGTQPWAVEHSAPAPSRGSFARLGLKVQGLPFERTLNPKTLKPTRRKRGGRTAVWFAEHTVR